MRWYWLLLLLASAVLAIVFWPRDRASENKQESIATITSDADVKPRANEAGAPETRRIHKAVPRLPTEPKDAPPVILDDRPKLPHEPWHTYHARLRLVKSFDACRRSVNLNEEQERAILLALYDRQQFDTELTREKNWAGRHDEFVAALDDGHFTYWGKLKKILTGDQLHRWQVSTDCAVLPEYSSDGALRLPGDSPRQLYGRYAMDLD